MRQYLDSQFFKVNKHGKENNILRTEDIPGAKPRERTWQIDAGREADKELMKVGGRLRSAASSKAASSMSYVTRIRPRLNNLEHIDRMILNLPGGILKMEEALNDKISSSLAARNRGTAAKNTLSMEAPFAAGKTVASMPQSPAARTEDLKAQKGRLGIPEPGGIFPVTRIRSEPQARANIEFNVEQKADRKFRNFVEPLENQKSGSIKQVPVAWRPESTKYGSPDVSTLFAARSVTEPNQSALEKSQSRLPGINPESLPKQPYHGRYGSGDGRIVVNSFSIAYKSNDTKDNLFAGGHKNRGVYGHGNFNEHRSPEKKDFLDHYSKMQQSLLHPSRFNIADPRNPKGTLYWPPPPQAMPMGPL